MTNQEFYQVGKKYSFQQDWDDEPTVQTVMNIRFSKTGRMSVELKNDNGTTFWTSAQKPETQMEYFYKNSGCLASVTTAEFKIIK